MLFLWDLQKLWSIWNIFIGSLSDYFPLLHNYDLISIWSKFDGMSRHHNSLSLQKLSHSLSHNKFSNMNVNRTQNIIKQKDVFLWVKCSSKRNPCLLASRYVDTFLAYLCFNSFWQHFQISLQRCIIHHSVELPLIVFTCKCDILFQCFWHDPRFLRRVRNISRNCYFGSLSHQHFIENGQQQTGLSTANITNYHRERFWLDFSVDVPKCMNEQWFSLLVFFFETF